MSTHQNCGLTLRPMLTEQVPTGLMGTVIPTLRLPVSVHYCRATKLLLNLPQIFTKATVLKGALDQKCMAVHPIFSLSEKDLDQWNLQNVKIESVYSTNDTRIVALIKESKKGQSDNSAVQENSDTQQSNPSPQSTGYSNVRTRASIEAHQNRQPEEKTSLEKEQERNEFHQEHVRKNNENAAARQQDAQKKRQAEEQARTQQLEQKRRKIEAEERRKEEEKQKNLQRYNQLKQQSNQNMRSASNAGMAALLVHYFIGKQIYSVENTDIKSLKADFAPMHSLQFGYGLSMNSINAYYKNLQSSGSTTSGAKIMNAPTIDLNIGYEFWGLQSHKWGIGFFGNVAAGHGILFQNFKLASQLGVKTYA